MLPTKKELFERIQSDKELALEYASWKEKYQQEFLDFCTGEKGVKVLYENSPKEFHLHENCYIHRAEQVVDSGLKLNLLQKYIFLPLDIFKKSHHNKPIRNRLEAWLTFFSAEDQEEIVTLLETYPEFLPLYKDLYELCLNTKKVMSMFSKELQELDRNTVSYMIDEMQEEINQQKAELEEKNMALQKKDVALQEKDVALQEQKNKLEEKDNMLQKKDMALQKQQDEIAALKKQLAKQQN